MTTNRRAPAVLAGLLAALVLCPTAAPGQRGPLRGLDGFIRGGMERWQVPGLAVAVVKGDSVVYAEGFGVRRVGEPGRVDPGTLFAIGSASKAFTAAAVGMLVDEGRVEWDDPVTDHLPGFQLFDPYATREMTVRDLLTHRSGLMRGDLLWYGSELDRDEILERVRHLEPTWSLRSNFGYQNIMYLAAGQVVAAVSGRSWDDFVDGRIFTPLGMEQSNTSVDPLPALENVAQPHAEIGGAVRSVPYRDIDNIAPAGSINSNVHEMAQWVRLQLRGGTLGGRELLKTGTVREMHTPQTIIRREGPWALTSPTSNFLAYGMGWFLHDYRGRKVVQHGGNIDGMHAMVGMMPEEDLGVVVLTNLSPNYLTTAILHRVFDGYLGGERPEWSDTLHARFEALVEQGRAQRKKLEDARVSGTRPSLALERYVGTFRNAMYGEAVVAREGDRLVLRRGPAFVGDLEHWHYDTFRVGWRDPAMADGLTLVTFELDSAGEVATLRFPDLGEFARVDAASSPGR